MVRPILYSFVQVIRANSPFHGLRQCFIKIEVCRDRIPALYTILQETINMSLCPFIVFLKSKAHQLNLKDMIELNRNLRIKLLLAGMNAR